MQISGLRKLNREAPIVPRQIGLQELIRVVQGRDPRQPQFLDQPVLEGVETAARSGPWPGASGRGSTRPPARPMPAQTDSWASPRRVAHPSVGRAGDL